MKSEVVWAESWTSSNAGSVTRTRPLFQHLEESQRLELGALVSPWDTEKEELKALSRAG